MDRDLRWIVTALAVASLALGAVSTGIEWASGTGLESGRFFDDFRVFRAAGNLVLDGDAAHLYDETQLGTLAFGSDQEALFLNPPVWAWVFVPLAGLDVGTGAAIWLLLGAAAMSAALRLLGRPWWWAGAAVLSLPGLLTFELGQSSFLSAALMALASWAILEERPVPFAVAVVLLFYKPHFAVGLVLVAVLARPRLRTAAVGAMGAWVLLAIVSLWMVPGLVAAWADNWVVLGEATIQHESAAVSVLAVGWPSWLHTASGWTIALAGIVSLVWIARRSADARVQVAAAALLGIWVAPHLLLYDWIVLTAPLAVLAGGVSPSIATVAGSGLVVAAVVAQPLESAQLQVFGGWIGIASVALISITLWTAVRVRGESPDAVLTNGAPGTRRPP